MYVIRLLKLKCNTYTFYIKGKRNRDIKRRKKRHEESERARERERERIVCFADAFVKRHSLIREKSSIEGSNSFLYSKISFFLRFQVSTRAASARKRTDREWP